MTTTLKSIQTTYNGGVTDGVTAAIVVSSSSNIIIISWCVGARRVISHVRMARAWRRDLDIIISGGAVILGINRGVISNDIVARAARASSISSFTHARGVNGWYVARWRVCAGMRAAEKAARIIENRRAHEMALFLIDGIVARGAAARIWRRVIVT